MTVKINFIFNKKPIEEIKEEIKEVKKKRGRPRKVEK